MVGEALSQAKGTFSSLWSTFTTTSTPAIPVENMDVKIDPLTIEPKEVTEPREGVIKQIAKKLHNSDMSLKQEHNTGSNQGGIVEIGREANTLD